MKTETLAPKTSARNYGVDTLRIISMLMIVTVHIFTQGGVLAAAEQGSAGWYAAWILRIFMIADVNCFALISGYVSVDSRFRASRVVSLWFQLIAYSVVISGVFRVAEISAFQPRATLFPVLSGRWWYMTAYFGVVFLIPFIGPLFDRISRRQASLLVFALICVFSLAPSLYNSDSFKLHGGYAMAWLGIMAVIGGYIKRFEPFKNIRKGWLLIYAACMGCVCAYKFIATAAGWAYPDRFVNFTSIFVLLGSIALLMFFVRINMAGPVKKVTKFVSPMAFGVYLIHVHPCVWNYVLAGRFAFLAEQSWIVMILGVLASALGIFVVCAAVDKVRALLFRLCRIDRLAELIGGKLTVLAEKVFK